MACCLRKVNNNDLSLLFDWANDEDVRKNSFSTKPITFEEHTAWFNKMLASSSIRQFICMDDDIAVGQIRITVEDCNAEIGYSIARECRGHGYGKQIVDLILNEIRCNYKQIKNVIAKVKPENIFSQKVFLSLGFNEAERTSEYFVYEKRLVSEEKKIFFRADINEKVATGHLMRCLSVAEAAKNEGLVPVFITSDKNADAILQKHNIEYICLNSKYDDLENELEAFISIIRKEQPKCVIIDSYYVTYGYLEKLTKHAFTIYIDDLYLFDYPTDGIICYEVYADEFNYKRDYKLKLTGPQYAPLRKEFANCKPKTINDNTENILILAGGSDRYNAIGQILDVLNKNKFCSVNAVCGKYNENYSELVRKFKIFANVHLIKNTDNIKELMEEADIVISAAGSTLYELCAIGTPTICYSFADNQIKNAMAFSANSVIDYLGDFRGKISLNDIADVICKLSHNKTLRAEMSSRMQACVDGCGSRRTISKIIENC